MREDEPDIEIRERILLEQPDMTFWAIYDARIAREAPSFFTIPAEVAAARFNTVPGWKSADSLTDLAGLIGVEPASLVATVVTYNAGISDGTPDATGREHRPVPIGEGPFYAIRHVGWSITSFAGLRIDDAMQVMRADGTAIPNLYAAGEVIGFGTTSGNAFVGGMSVTPAMTFGRMLGTRLGKASAR